MGFFSWKCEECGHPMLSDGAVNHVNSWMNDVVVIIKNGSILKGSYDGYGRVDDIDIDWDSGEPQCYHLACWESACEPTEHRGESKNAEDQGWFFNEGDHDVPDPRRANVG